MLNVENLALELDQDFENLTNSAMEWSEKTWRAQVLDNRFDGGVSFNHSHIYWFDCYAGVIAAKSLLRVMGHDLSIIFDTALEQWAITTNYVSIAWRD